MEQQLHANARHLQAQAEIANRELAEAKEQLSVQKAKVKEQLMALSYRHTEEVTQLRNALEAQLDAALQQKENDSVVIQESIKLADHIAADVSSVDSHLHKVCSYGNTACLADLKELF
jgi:tRNA U34 5-carboxymethylaminomethyl modifying GTPase MnmE/TrmE